MKATLQKRFGRIVLGVVVIGAIAVGVYGAIMWAIAQEKQRTLGCLSSMRMISNAVLMYRHDYDGRMPLPSNWSESVACYFGCGFEGNYDSLCCPEVPVHFLGAGYAMVALPLPVSRYDPLDTPMLFETETIARNAYATEVILPDPPRHWRGSNVAFLDGRVKTLPRSVRVWQYPSLLPK